MIKKLTPRKCILLLKKSGCSKEVIDHCKCVRDLAILIAKKTDADLNIVEIGALLHDIGRSKTHGIEHGIEGVEIAKNYELDPKIIKIIERHIGAGITPKIAEKLGLPNKNYSPVSIEEKIVCHADNLIDNCKRQKIGDEIDKALKNNQKEYAKKLAKLHSELSEICGIDLDYI